MILIISLCKEKLSEEEFVKPLIAIIKSSGKKYKTVHYTAVRPSRIEEAEKIILSGTALQDNEYLEHLTKFDWLKECRKPVLGICSGMQIIALQFGASIIKKKEIGMRTIKTLKPNRLLRNEFEAYELHGNALSNLNQFIILAESAESVQAIKHASRELYGIMFHPEVRNEQVVKNFLALPAAAA